MVPEVLVHAEHLDAVEARLVGVQLGQQSQHGVVHRGPGRVELAGQPGHRGVLPAQLPGRPPHRPPGQQRPWGGEVFVLLGEHPLGAQLLRAPPGPFPPDQLGRTAETGNVDQPMVTPAVA